MFCYIQQFITLIMHYSLALQQMLKLSFFSMDAGLQPSPRLFDSLVNNTLFHISPHVRQSFLLKFL